VNITAQPLKTRDAWIDALRCLAAFLVIIDHNAVGLDDFGAIPTSDWMIANVLKTFSKAAVPLFLMISGYLLLPINIDALQFYRTRLKRIAVPWLFWSAVYLWVRRLFESQQISLLSMARLVWIGEVYYHMWFMYVLLGVYLSLPFISKMLMEADSRQTQLGYLFLSFWVITQSIVPLLSGVLRQSTGFEFTPSLLYYLPLFTGYTGFVFLGSVLGHAKLTSARLWLSGALLVLSLCVTAVVNYCRASGIHAVDALFLGHPPNGIIMCASAFYLSRCLVIQSSFVKTMATCSFGVYLIHPLIMNGLVYATRFEYLATPLCIPVRAFIVWFLSALSVWLLMKVPLLRNVVS
jgi:surface polysaccharide O-acyltransferase-like enzyme